jgi:hypothetical protein
MMKHIKRKFLKQQKVDVDISKMAASAPIEPGQEHAGYRAIMDDGYYPLILSEQNDLIQGFFYKAGNKSFMIPEPNLITVYFDISQAQIKFLYPAKADLLMNIGRNGDLGTTLNATHTFFHYSCISIFFLYNSVEAVINLQLPLDKEYVWKDAKKTVVYSHDQIQTGISFEEKIKSVLPQFLNRSFHQEYGHKYETILKLKDVRDEIAHTKVYAAKDRPNYYKEIFTKLLDFDYNKALQHSRDFINYFQPDLIEECNCGRRD